MTHSNVVTARTRKTKRVLTFASIFAGVTTYALLPESVRPLTRISLSLHAILIAVVASELVLPSTALATRLRWRIRVSLPIALISFFMGRVSDVLFRSELDWPGMWNFLGLMTLIWAVLLPDNSEPSKESGSALSS
jgi:hypothetical protein